jgi:thioesterase domain-containing protein
MIAVEMAKQLQAAGKQVTMLGMIDTYVDNVVLFDTKRMQLVKKIKRQLPKLRFIVRSFLRYPKDTIMYQLKRLNNRALSLAGKEQVAISAEQSFQNRIYKQYEKAYLAYRLTPYNQPIHLFKVKKRLYFLDEPRYLGWKPFAQAGLHVHLLQGDHKTFIHPPYEDKFVRALMKAIETAEQHGAS